MRHTLIAATAICLTSFSCITGNAQQVVDVDKDDLSQSSPRSIVSTVIGQLVETDKFVRVTAGSPFFKDQWMKARLFDADGNSYASQSVKLDLYDNQVNFLDASGRALVATTQVKVIMLTDTTTGTQYLFVLGDQVQAADKALGKTWLQVLVNGNVSLCRQIKKTIHQDITYATSTTEEQIMSIDFYFIQSKGSFTRIKTWSDLVNLFSDHKDSVDQYIHDHHLKGKSDDDYVDLVRFYNSLLKT
jgi:hypothetical protein